MAAETSPSLFRVISSVCSSPLSSGLHRDFCYKLSEKWTLLKVIENKVSPRLFRKDDIQSVGHTWLLSDKTLSSSNSCSLIVASVGGQEDTSDAFSNPFTAPQYWVSFWQGGGRARFALCVQARTLTALAPQGRKPPSGFWHSGRFFSQ